MDTQKTLPQGWRWVKLGEVCEIIMGQSPPSNTYNTDGVGLPFFQGKAEFTDLHPVAEKWCSKPNKIAKPFDILLSVRAPVGTTNIADEQCCIGRGLAAIRYRNYKYLLYFLKTIEKKLDSQGTGTTFRAISGSIIKAIAFPLAPAELQNQIVSKIEELFSELDKGVENLRLAQQQLNTYRKACLFEGVTGKLTCDWRKQNPIACNSEQMFEKIQQALDDFYKQGAHDALSKGKRKLKDQRKNKKAINIESELPQLPSTWNYYRLEDITYLVTDGTHFTPRYQEDGIKFLSVKNVRPFYIRDEHIKYISQDDHKLLIERCNPQKDDILYTKVGATFGYAAKINVDYEFSIFVSLCLIKPVHEYFSSNFLEILMNSELVFRQARQRVSGSGVPDLHLIEIRDFKIPLPSLEEQNVIVQIVQSRLSLADKLEDSIQSAIQQADVLRQSILKHAFEGKLVSEEKNLKKEIENIKTPALQDVE